MPRPSPQLLRGFVVHCGALPGANGAAWEVRHGRRARHPEGQPVSFVDDLRAALRALLRAPAFFGMATGVMSLGMAVVVTMFGFLRVTMTPPPLDRIDRVFALSVADARHGQPEKLVRLQDVEDWGREQKSFEGMAGFLPETIAFRPQGANAERCAAARVKGPFFEVLRIHPLLGRNLVAEDSRFGASPVVVLSERLWRSRLGADPSVVGALVYVDGQAHTVVGVAPASLDLPVSALLWFADRTNTTEDSFFTRHGPGPLPRLLAPELAPIGRLRDGVPPEVARAELRWIQARRVARYPELATELPDVRPLSILWMGGEYQRLFRVLFGSVLLVLVLACVNVAGLLLVRGAARTYEAAVRLSLGASRGRLAGQMLAESAVVGATSTLLALVLAEGAMEALRRVIPAVLPAAPSWWRMRLDAVTVAFALGTAIAAALGAGLYPAIRVARVSVDPLLRDGQRETALHTTRLVRWLVVVEIALSSALLTTAGLVIRSGSRLGTGDVGVPTAGFLTGHVKVTVRHNFAAQRLFVRRLVDGLKAIPGMEAATVTTAPPGIESPWRPTYQVFGSSRDHPEELPSARVVLVTPGFFETFKVPVVQGRTFLDSDTESKSTVAVVSEAMARASWPGESPIGKYFQVAPEEPWVPLARVVGVVGDVRYDQGLRSLGRTPPVIYVPLDQWPMWSLWMVLRNPRDPNGAAAEVRRIIREIEPEASVPSLRPLDEERERNAAGLILIGRMFAAFGAVALALAASGVYAVVAYSAAQRTREIAIRRALGAASGHVLILVVARSGWQLLLGLALGLLLAPAMGAVMDTVIGEPDSALLVYPEVAGVLSAALLLSILVPLRRALALEPSAVLRQT
jgi:putative ABC transport system permease protein